MRSRDLIKLLSAETGIPDHSDPGGPTVWRNAQGQLHRDFGPALIRPNGAKEWYRNGKLHREDGPAVMRPDGLQLWWRNGLIHRAPDSDRYLG